MSDMRQGWWWLSFADPDRPEGERFLGVAIVEGDDAMDAMQTAWNLGCNPGGEILATQYRAKDSLSDDWINLLLSEDDLRKARLIGTREPVRHREHLLRPEMARSSWTRGGS
jgi:hypothetical protein